MLEKSTINLAKPVNFAKPENSSTESVRFEKSNVSLAKPVNLKKQITDDAALIAEMQSEIEQLQSVIAKLNYELEQIDNPPEIELTLKERLVGFIRGKLSPRALIALLIKNVKKNITTYVISGLLAGTIASGLEAVMKARSLEDIKNITSVMQEQALKQVNESIDAKTASLNERIETIEVVSQKLEKTQSKLLGENAVITSKSSALQEALNKTKSTLNTTKEKIVIKSSNPEATKSTVVNNNNAKTTVPVKAKK